MARGILFAHGKGIGQPINLGSGIGVSIKEIAEIITKNMKNKPEIVWDTSKPSGDKKRLMDISRAKAIGFQPMISIKDGIKEVMDWYQKKQRCCE